MMFIQFYIVANYHEDIFIYLVKSGKGRVFKWVIVLSEF